jgi:hypothetical protein
VITLILAVIASRWDEVKGGLWWGSAIGLGTTLGQIVSETWFHNV